MYCEKKNIKLQWIKFKEKLFAQTIELYHGASGLNVKPSTYFFFNLLQSGLAGDITSTA